MARHREVARSHSRLQSTECTQPLLCTTERAYSVRASLKRNNQGETGLGENLFSFDHSPEGPKTYIGLCIRTRRMLEDAADIESRTVNQYQEVLSWTGVLTKEIR